MAIKGLIFDLDGTVTMTQQFHAQAFSEVFKKHGLIYTTEDDARYSGRGSHCTFPEFFKEHGITLTREQVDQYSKEKRELYMKIIKDAAIEYVPGVEQFLKKQKNRGMKIALATGNHHKPAKILLAHVGLQEYFLHIVTNQDIKKSKPAPDIFLKAAEELDLMPEECIVFEDAVNGVEAAKKAGIKCVALLTTTPREKLLAAGADLIVKSYDEIPADFLK